MPKFGVPFSGAADQMIGGDKEAAMAAPFPAGQSATWAEAHELLDKPGHDGYEPMAVTEQHGHKPMHRSMKSNRGD